MPATVEFWLTVGSTYTYLAVHRMKAAADAAGVAVSYRPFYLGKLFREAGYWPFHEGSAKTAYMWLDIERRAATLGLGPRFPAPYPSPQTDLANRICRVVVDRGLGSAWLQSSYREWFENGHLPGTDAHIANSLPAVGLNPDEIIAIANDPATETAMSADTELPKASGIFGAPTFRVGNEIFWGDDRIDDAIVGALAQE